MTLPKLEDILKTATDETGKPVDVRIADDTPPALTDAERGEYLARHADIVALKCQLADLDMQIAKAEEARVTVRTSIEAAAATLQRRVNGFGAARQLSQGWRLDAAGEWKRT